MRIFPPRPQLVCQGCGRAYRPTWRDTKKYCGQECYGLHSRAMASAERLDRLMELYKTTTSYYLRDLWLTMADEEAGILATLTGWKNIQ